MEIIYEPLAVQIIIVNLRPS